MCAKRHVRAIAVAAVVLSILPSRAAALQEQDGEIRLRGDEVLLDLVVTDRRGRPVVDLRPGEVEVFENGARQSLTSFGLVRGAPGGDAPGAAAGAAPAGPLAASPLRDVNLILVVVDRGTVEQSDLSQVYRAAERFVKERLATNDLVAVFATTNRLVLLQNFTSNKERLLDALRRATTGTSVALQESLDPAARARLADQQARADAPPAVGSVDGRGAAEADAELYERLDAAAQGVDTAFASVRDQIQALSVINGILALTRLYSSIPGRKSIVLYSEGFVVADESEGAFSAMVGAANRGNFTVYPVSAGGLRASVTPVTVMPRRGTPVEESDQRMAVSGGESGLDRMTRPARTDNDQALSRLAAETGGVLVRNTNDLGRGFDAIESDLRAHYLVSYAPSDASLDGSFREITVRVARKDVEVRTRKGYYAVPGGAGALPLPHEQPVLAMLASAGGGSARSDLDVSLRTERFPVDGGWRVPIVVGVEAAGLAPSPAPEGDAIDFAATAVALVRDASGAVVAKLSRPAVYRTTKAQLEAFRAQTVAIPQFADPLVLAPGRYTLQVGVYDPKSGKGSVLERRITVPPVPAGAEPALGSLVLASAAEAVSDAERPRAASDPFVFGGTARVVASPTARFAKSRGDRLIAYFRLRGAPGARYRMQLQFVREGRPPVSTPVEELPPADASGMSGAAPVFGLERFEPGDYRAILLILGPDSTEPLATTVTSFRVES